MPELKMRDWIKPFCPIHHWRMAHDSGSNKVEPSYRCSFETCTMRYSLAAGYFEAATPTDAASLSHLEIVACKQNREHHPSIVSYAKESVGSQSEEWREWRCFADNCGFSVTQKLSPAESDSCHAMGLAQMPARSAQHDHSFAKR
jgi:hypothetical protein